MVDAQVLSLPTTSHELLEEQTKLEAWMQGIGMENFRKSIERAKQGHHESDTPYGLAMVSHCLEGMTQAILDFMALAKSGKPGPKHHAVKYMEQVQPEVAAMLTLRLGIDCISAKYPQSTTAVAIGRRIEDEVRFRFFNKEAKPLFRVISKSAAKATTYRHKRRVVVHAMGKAKDKEGNPKPLTWNPWPEEDQLHLGVKLLEIMKDVTGLIDFEEHFTGRGKSVKYIVGTEKVTTWMAKQNARCELLTPAFMPCVIQPRDWTNTRDGGYWTDALPPLSLVKTPNSAYLDELDNRVEEMPMVYATVNALQRTPWRINARVMDVAQVFIENKLDLAGIPAFEDLMYVPCPKCGQPVALSQRDVGRAKTARTPHDCFIHDEEALVKWKRSAAKVHEKNVKLRSKRIKTAMTLRVAETYAKYDQFYFPYQLDFRGRVYAVPTYLSPQGDDLAKGLLTFGEGKAITDGTAAGWLAIHGANTYGYDKASLEDRIAWVEKNEARILATAQFPLADLWWTEADSPWCFLAFCFEWAAFQAEGFGFKSSLPIAMDATCSGLQHFSGMLRDAVGGRAVNLTANEERADIYGEVCKKFVDKLRLDVGTNAYAQMWLNLNPDRSTVKRQVMTLPYGATPFSCREYTEAWAKEKCGDELPWEDKQMFEATQYASALIWQSIGEVVVKAREAMDWLQKLAKLVAAEDLPVVWTTPVGLPIQQRYADYTTRRVKTTLGDSVAYFSLRKDTGGIDRRKMQSSIAPNFVHSMDAAQLMWSVAYALDNGVTHFAMIHDSYGCHAADTAMLAACLREAFVDMYTEHDVLAEFKQAMVDLLPEESIKKLPADLEPGALDLEEVKRSEFFFS